MTDVRQYAVHEVTFEGPTVSPADAPAAAVDFATTWRHEDGEAVTVGGFHDGDGEGGPGGDVFRVRFCPTEPGTWTLAATTANVPELAGVREGLEVECLPADRPGFWEVDERGPGRRWYRRSDGSHPYVFGNTHYSFLSGRTDEGEKEHGIAEDVAANAEYFDKLRFSVTGDRYPHPDVKPFLDDDGEPTDDGDHSHRPNPTWFGGRVDAAVRAADEHDLAADLILNGPDTRESRSVLRAGANGGDNRPFLEYVAARYGSFPTTWFCLSNEWDIKEPTYTAGEIRRAGERLRGTLPYPTPVSVHASPRPWPARLGEGWYDHAIVQNKLKSLTDAADTVDESHRIAGTPTINDELAYQGTGDGWSRGDVVEAALGAFLGGGYASTGYKPGDKVTQYFWGDFDPGEHTAAANLRWLAGRIESATTFHRLAPVDLDASPFGGVREGRHDTFRALSWPDREYVLGSNAASEVSLSLPWGEWTLERFDAMAMAGKTIREGAGGTVAFATPDSRAGMVVARRTDAPDFCPSPG